MCHVAVLGGARAGGRVRKTNIGILRQLTVNELPGRAKKPQLISPKNSEIRFHKRFTQTTAPMEKYFSQS
jgi:hypothetical protein